MGKNIFGAALVGFLVVMVFGGAIYWYSHRNNSVTVETVVESDESEVDVQMPRGEADPNLVVTVYDADKVYKGTTFLDDHYNSRFIEVNMLGEIIWEYKIPDEMTNAENGAFDAELLDNGNILINVLGSGVHEIDRDGNIVWSYLVEKVSHDADRLPNGNTLINFGMNDMKKDATEIEVDPDGNIVWQWFAKDVYGDDPEFKDISEGGWAHANAVQRLDNGNTLVSLRNFNMTVIVDKEGKVVNEYRYDDFGTSYPHEPVMMDNGNLLVCLQAESPYQVVELNPEQEVVWTYADPDLRTTRDCNRLPNGNTLIVSVDTSVPRQESIIREVTPEGEIVWELRIKEPVDKGPGWFFKAERVEEF